ncbi:hypothetical protein [Pseudomonas moraviensis]|uniref:hypothetical protein n=1 Tax=Pseudomonas moraviensis TaxID=321662 RepID=UPI001179C2E4|nr:hypothetical protein [Pseudomonas moraviensis]
MRLKRIGGAHSFGFIGVVKGVNGTREQKLNPKKRSQPSAAPTDIDVGAAEGCDLLIFSF